MNAKVCAKEKEETSSISMRYALSRSLKATATKNLVWGNFQGSGDAFL